MNAVSHIGIAVADLDKAIKAFSEILDCEPVEIEDVPDQKVRVAIFRPGGKDSPAIELICPLTQDSPVQKFLDKRGEGLHHICLKVADLPQKLDGLKKNNVKLIDSVPRKGAEGKKIAFIYPSAVSGVLIELEQD